MPAANTAQMRLGLLLSLGVALLTPAFADGTQEVVCMAYVYSASAAIDKFGAEAALAPELSEELKSEIQSGKIPSVQVVLRRDHSRSAARDHYAYLKSFYSLRHNYVCGSDGTCVGSTLVIPLKGNLPIDSSIQMELDLALGEYDDEEQKYRFQNMVSLWMKACGQKHEKQFYSVADIVTQPTTLIELIRQIRSPDAFDF